MPPAPGSSSSAPAAPLPPRPGLLARLRNRYGLVTSVQEDDGPDGRQHLVTVEYLDPEGAAQETLLWEAEPFAQCVEPATLPDVDGQQPMGLEEYRALVRATRWTALEPFIDPDGADGPLDRSPLASPLHGAIQAEDYQMLPLWQAMRMPRVTLMLADDVGLGKTIEAGLILSELIRRRRAKRVLILCPASLRGQWVRELATKFSLDFDIVDRPATHELQRRFGMDVNPWRSLSRIVTSYDYLKQPDVFESFRAASRTEEGAVHLPWDLLVVDEAHNLAPAPLGKESEVARLLQQLSPLFEHRLFLTATPHNGHTASYTGLLEALDPVRFSRKWEPLTEPEKQRRDQVVVRRLKSEVNQRDRELGRTPRFSDRHVRELSLGFGRGETQLLHAFSALRARLRSLTAQRAKAEERAGTFAIEILGKRLLSSPVTFADSWHRYQEGARAEDGTSPDEVTAAKSSSEEELADDREAERRRTHAVATVGRWLRPFVESGELRAELSAIDAALAQLGLGADGFDLLRTRPREDARFAELCGVIDSHLRDGAAWRTHERLVIFTEYKTTLDHLHARLVERYPGADAVQVLYGGLSPEDREAVTGSFNDPTSPLRILVATDTASEGLNLQETARHLLHYDVPWNPSRLEQRNGRLDRHGQARDVHAFHFSSEADDDVRFLGRVVDKVHKQREDLGSVGDVFDAAFERRLLHGTSSDEVIGDLDAQLEAAQRSALRRDERPVVQQRDWERGERERRRLDALAHELDLSPDTLRSSLQIALGGALEGPDDRGRYRLQPRLAPEWNELVDEHLRVGSAKRGPKGALQRLLFDPSGFLQRVAAEDGATRTVFRPEPDVALLHLGHPLFHRALGHFARFRFPATTGPQRATRWTVTRPIEGRGPVPAGCDALLLVTVEEFAVNELREAFHHWVRTLAIPVRRTGNSWSVDAVLPHQPAPAWQAGLTLDNSADARRAAQDLWLEVDSDVRATLEGHRASLQQDLLAALKTEHERARTEANELFQSRHGDLSTLIRNNTIARLEAEIAGLQQRIQDRELFDTAQDVARFQQDLQAKEQEVKRRTSHWESLQAALESERKRVLERVLPRRHQLHGDARVFPVGVEVVLPGAAR